MDLNNHLYENSSKISFDTSISTKDSKSTSKEVSEKSGTLIVISEKEIQAELNLKIYSNSSLNSENQSKKRINSQEAKEKSDKNANYKDDNYIVTAKIIKITSYEEDTKKVESLTDKLEEYITRRNISMSENSISFEINFEKWCQKTFNKNMEDYIADKEKDTDKEKEILKNGNIDQLFDYINSNDKKISEKKKNKRKRKNKNKGSKEAFYTICNGNNSTYFNKNKIEKANCDENTVNSGLTNNNIGNSNIKLQNPNCYLSKICDDEVELFKQNIVKDNKKASDTLKIKPIFSTNWLQTLN